MCAAKQETKGAVTDYLAALVWDGTARLDRWLIDYAGADDTAAVRAASRVMLVAAVRRARDPGCRFDQMVVLEGPQGCGQLSALRVLAVEDAWFTDELPFSARELVEIIASKWIVVASELRSMDRSDIGALKAFLSRQHDVCRRSYTQVVTQVPRQFVVVGTATTTEGYLCDATGNRRFWPVRVQCFNLEKLRADRDQLWAEAARVEATGGSVCLSEEGGVVAEESTMINVKRAHVAVESTSVSRHPADEARSSVAPLVAMLQGALGDRTGRLRELAAYRICGIDPGKVNEDRFWRVMRELGWERMRCRFGDGSFQYAYVRGTAPVLEELVVEYDLYGRAVVR